MVADGDVWCWGNNNSGQLGQGVAASIATPVKVPGLPAMTQVSASAWTTCGRSRDGQVWCWGSNTGQILGTSMSSVESPVQLPGLSGVEMVFTGAGFACVSYQSGGPIECWGINNEGQLGDGTTTQRSTPEDVPGIQLMSSYRYDEPAVALYGNAICAAGNPPKCWGSNYRGRLGDGTTEDRLVPTDVQGGLDALHVSLGNNFGCASDGGRSVWCWGENSSGQLGDGTSTTSLSPQPVRNIDSVKFIRSGARYTCTARRTTGVLCWGRNTENQLGNPGAGGISSVPVDVQGLENVEVSDVATGTLHACAYGDGRVWCWGDGSTGQLGGPSMSGTAIEVDWLR